MAFTTHNASNRDCDDRINHPNIPAGQVCSAISSAPRDLGKWIWQACRPAVSPYHAAGHRICGVCHDDSLTDPLVANTLIEINTATPTAGGTAAWHAPGGIGPPNSWRGFLTGLCSQCEVYEQTKYLEFMSKGLLAAAMGLTGYFRDGYRQFGSARAASEYLWPRNGCTCSFTIDGATEDLTSSKHPRRCRQDLLDHVTALNAQRDANDAYLRGIARDAKGQTCRASMKKIRSRDSAKRSSYRACRCGADVDTIGKPEVLMCLGCEGVVHIKAIGGIGPTVVLHGNGAWLANGFFPPGTPLSRRTRPLRLRGFGCLDPRTSTYRRSPANLVLGRAVMQHTA